MLTLTITSIECFEVIVRNKKLLEAVRDIAVMEEQAQSYMSYFMGKVDQRKFAINESIKLFTLWTDLTMMY